MPDDEVIEDNLYDPSAVDLNGNGNEEQTPQEVYKVDEVIDPDKQEKAPKQRNKPRSNASSFLTMLWGGVGTVLIKSGSDVPVGRVMQFQAPMAGEKIDQFIANTWLDKIIQPMVKAEEQIEGLGAVVMLPLLIGAYERQPLMADMIEPILREVVSISLIEMAPVIKRKAAKEKAALKALSSVKEGLGVGKDENPIDAILATIFEGFTFDETDTEAPGED